MPADVSEQSGGTEEVLEADERDMTIGELYDIHKELSEIEESIKAGEPVEKAKGRAVQKEEEPVQSGKYFPAQEAYRRSGPEPGRERNRKAG